MSERLEEMLRIARAAYRVTVDGRVFSTESNWRGYGEREMQQQINSHGYPSVRVLVNGRRKRITVHRLVAFSYLPPRPSPEHEVRHLDGNKSNNLASNLAWGTRSENARDRTRHGTEKAPENGRVGRIKMLGELSSTAKLTDRQAASILARHAAGESARLIASDFPFVNVSAIRMVCKGVTFGHLSALTAAMEDSSNVG